MLDKDIFFHLLCGVKYVLFRAVRVCVCEFFCGWLITLIFPGASQSCV